MIDVCTIHILIFTIYSSSCCTRQERHRIDVDCRRTDRTQPLFSAPAQIPSVDLDEEKNLSQRYSIISPSMSDIGAQSPSNEHIDRLAGILLTYNFYEKELGTSLLISLVNPFIYCTKGYVQGMSDLCAPLYVVMAADEEMTFWCFVIFMNRMVTLSCHLYHQAM